MLRPALASNSLASVLESWDDRPAPPYPFSSYFYFKLMFLAPQTPVPTLCILKMIVAKQWWPRL